MGSFNLADILASTPGGIKPAALEAVLAARREALRRSFWDDARALLEQLPDRAELIRRGCSLREALDSAVVSVGVESDLNAVEQTALAALIRRLVPWRKGPFELFGCPIDAEWRSDMKWERIRRHIPPLEAMRVLDVGCNNGYYLFRLLGHCATRGENPELLLGVDPSEAFCFAFDLVQRFLARPNLRYELLGIEHAPLFPGVFDLVFCLGIVYHQRDPLTALRGLRESMRAGGTLILESQTVPGEEPSPLIVSGRYAKARNVYFVPTPVCLAAWAEQAGFSNARVVSTEIVTAEEQRRTDLAPYESLADFLDPCDSGRTVEGYPAPRRSIVIAEA